MYITTICGGGNAAHVLLGLLGSHNGVSVQLFDTLADEVEQFRKAGPNSAGQIQVSFNDGRDDVTGVIDKISTEAADVIPDSDMVILAVPAFAHEMYFREIAKYAKPGCIVGVMVAKGGVDWQFQEVFRDKLDQTQFFAMENLPWACRIEEFGNSVAILGTKLALEMGVYSDSPNQVVQRVSDLISIPSVDDATKRIPEFSQAPNFISCSLRGNLGHACIMYGRFRDWDSTSTFDEVPLFYEGVDEFAADILAAASNEVMEIKTALTEQLGIDLGSVIGAKEWLIKVYGDDIRDKSTLQSCITTNKGYRGLTHAMVAVETGYVPSKTSRYLTEDMPFGILVVKGIADVVGVPTPTLDRVIEWNQEFMGKEYLIDGKLNGADILETRSPQRYGITEPRQLIGGFVKPIGLGGPVD